MSSAIDRMSSRGQVAIIDKQFEEGITSANRVGSAWY